MKIFLHCHKAAGTTVVSAAEASGMKLPQDHRNGNAVDESRKPLDWNSFSDQEVIDRIEGLRAAGVDMLSFEFQIPKWSVLNRIPDLTYFTVIREPAARAFSNYRMDVLNNLVNTENIFGFSSFMNSASLFRADNFYVRFFSRAAPKAYISQDHLRFAKAKLDSFATVCVMERNELAEKLAPLGFSRESFGWENVNAKKKKFVNYDEAESKLKIKDFPEDIDFFSRNSLDYALYSYFLHKSVQSDAS